MAKKRNVKRKLLQYDHESLVKAVDEVKNGSLSIRAAAKRFKVPKSTIADKISGRSDLDTNIGRQPALPKFVEDKVVGNVIEASKRGMGISRRQLFARTHILCSRLKVAAFKNGAPGRGWWNGLKRRHPEMTIRKPEKLGNSRARMLNPTVVSKYMNDLGDMISKLNLHDKPEHIWNCDETGKQFQHTPVKVISQKGARNVVGRVSENKTNTTIMVCVNGAGGKMVPMVVVKGKTSATLHGLNVTDAPPGTVFAYQENGWMSEKLGEMWFRDVFLKNCGPDRPQLLILDGHSSHETLGLLELAIQENIHIICLPPHTSHMLQPLDRSVFGPFNTAYNTACSEFLSESPYHIVNKGSFLHLFHKAFDNGITRENVVNGFKACGIVPFNPDAIPSEAFHPSIATENPLPQQHSSSDNPTSVPPVSQRTCTITRPPSVSALSDLVNTPPITHSADNTNQSTSTPLSVPETLSVCTPFFLISDSQRSEAESTFTPLSISETVSPQQPLIPLETTCSTDTFVADDPEALLALITTGQCQIVEDSNVKAPAYDIEIQRNVNENRQDGVYDLYEKMYPPRKACFDKLCEIEEHPVRGLKPRASIDESLIHYVIQRENMQFE
uniref:Uncharacterized protein LOC111118860 n=1 Tax=Crassostrea virginica TaxID=6565 RepID=A0A8B8CEP3_CRAVI|nr:uncharacterized protein LOC111118860 [Crassostrea virginica]